MRALVGVAVLMVLAACGGSPTATTAPTATRVAAATATATNAPPAIAAPDASQVVTDLTSGGVPVGQVKVYSSADDPNSLLGRPGQYTSKASFTLTNIPADKQDASDPYAVNNGGTVEVFANTNDVQQRLTSLKASQAIAPEYDSSQGTILLRLSHALTPAQAASYQQALAKIIH